MRIKFIFILSLLLAAVSCSKSNEEPSLPPGDPDDPTESEIHPDLSKIKINTPKGWVYPEPVYKKDLPVWLLDKTESINWGYIMKAGSGDALLYFVYDEEKEFGRHYNASGKPTEDNPKLKDWVIVYQWPQTHFMFTPKGWVYCKYISPEYMPEWLQSRVDGIAKGYILRAELTTDELLYYVYDEDKDDGKYYDAQGNPAQDNPDIKRWIIIYRWDPTSGMYTFKGWADYKLVTKEDLPAWLQTAAESIPKGHIVKIFTYSDEGLYYVYDEGSKEGKYYDLQGNPMTNIDIGEKYLVIIYQW